MNPITRTMLTTLALSLATPAAAENVDPRAYPELAPDVLLPPILAELKHMLNDPYSIRDFVMCPASRIKLKDGKPVKWNVQFSLNAKNAYGGYAGVKMFSASFRDGHLSGPISSTQFASNEGLEGLINGMIAKTMATCPTLPDAKVQALLSPEGSIYRAN